VTRVRGWSVALLALSLTSAACQRDRKVGHEREACRPDHTCEPGLLCLSDLCVRPPPGDCGAVAEALASLELGNYAPVEQRASVVATKRAACDKAQVSKDEAACIDKARDRWSVAQCVPRMFPELAPTGGGDCAAIIRKVRALIEPTVAQVGSDARTMIDKMMPAMQQSCEQDGWPAALKQCILAATPGDLQAMKACEATMPKGLQDKLQQRMIKVQQGPQ
jgi:hypothetical protein